MSCCTIKGGASKCAISLTGIVTTLAGGTTSGSDDGTGTSARFSSPIGITSDGTNLYVTESANHRIRKIVIATGVVSTLAGSTQGFNNATGTAAQFNIPEGITSDGTNLYVSDSNNQIIRKIVIASGVVSTLAGTAGSTGSTDDTGTAARFNEPRGITTDGTNLYVADYINNRIRKVVIATGVVTTLAGSGAGSFKDDTGTSAEFRFPYSITTDGTNLYVADQFNHRIRKIVIATAVVTTLARSTQGFIDSTGTSAQFKQPRGITTDGVNLYVADTSNNSIRKIE